MNISELKLKLTQLQKDMLPSAENLRNYAGIVVERRRTLMLSGMKIDETGGQTPLKQSTILRKMGAHSTKHFRSGFFAFVLGKRFYKGKVESFGQRTASAIKKGTSQRSIAPQTPLIDTGMMMNPLPIRVSGHSAFIEIARSRGKGSAGGKSISEVHQKGTGRIPARPHFGIAPSAERKILTIEGNRLKRIIEKF